MMNAWKLHQASSDRNRMNWCLLLQFARIGGPIAFSGVVSTYVGYFLQANYQKVLFDRPLIYIYFDQMSHLELNWNGDWANVRIALDGLRAACARKELPVPYIVIMSGAPSVAYSVMSAVAGDAISNYIGPVTRREAQARSSALKLSYSDLLGQTGCHGCVNCADLYDWMGHATAQAPSAAVAEESSPWHRGEQLCGRWKRPPKSRRTHWRR